MTRSVRSLHWAVAGAMLALCLLMAWQPGDLFAEGRLSVNFRFGQAGDDQPLDWRAMAVFSREVKLADVKKSLTATVDGKPLELEFLDLANLEAQAPGSTPQPEERNRFVIAPRQALQKPGKVELLVAAGLKGAGQEELEASLRQSFKAVEAVDAKEVKAYFDGSTDRGVTFRLPGTVDSAELLKQTRILPPVGALKVAENREDDGESVIKIKGNTQTGKSYKLMISGGSYGREDKVLRKALIPFVGMGPAPTVKFETQKSVLELRSRQLVPVSLLNVSEVRTSITRLPALFAPQFSSLMFWGKNDAKRPRSVSDARREEIEKRETSINEAAKGVDEELAKVGTTLADCQKLAQEASGKEINLEWFLGDLASTSEGFAQQTAADKAQPLSLPVTFRPRPEQGGPVLVSISDAKSAETDPAVRVFQVTDLSITYRRSQKSLLLWVTSLETGKPMADAAIMVVDRNDRRFFPGRTDKDGLLLVKDGQSAPALSIGTGSPSLAPAPLTVADLVIALAATAQDAAFIELETNRFRPYGLSQVPLDKVESRNRTGHLFTERGVYRPGETVFWKATSRRYENHAIVPPAGEKVQVTITSSRDDTLVDEEFELNEFGTCSGALQLKDFSPLGQYTISVRQTKPAQTASATTDEKKDSEEPQLIAQTGFQVQKFEPPRHYVKIQTETKHREDPVPVIGRKLEQEYLETKIQGLYYTGGFLKMAKVRWTAHLVPVQANVPGFDGHFFGAQGSDKTLIESGEGLLNEKGELALQLPVDRLQMNGLNGIEIGAVVLDVDGRPAATVETWKPKTRFRVGITRMPGGLMEGESLTAGVVVVDDQGKPVSEGAVRLDILRKRYFYSQKRDEDGNIFYRWESGWVKAISSDKPLDKGAALFDLAFVDSGDYRLQAVYVTQDGEYSSRVDLDIGYSYYDDDSSEDSDKPKQRSDHEITLVTSRDVADVGAPVKGEFTLLRPAPFALITAERDEIYEYRVIALEGRHGQFEVAMKPEYRPNVYLHVTVPGPRTGFSTWRSQVDANLPTILYGVQNVKVQDRVGSLKISISPDEAKLTGRPGETRKLAIGVTDIDGKPAQPEMAVCVVDEAILSLTGFQTPVLSCLTDFVLPLSVFAGDLRLSLVTQELYRLFATKALTGGDMGAGGLASDLALRKDFRPVPYWNAGLIPGPDGKAVIEFKLPDSTTAYRCYVVAIDKKAAFASFDRQMVVTKEFYLQPGMPRFLTAGDAAVFPVALNNKTESAGKIEPKIEESKNVLAKLEQNEVEVPALTTGVAKVAIKADNGPGDAALTFSGRMGEFKDAILQTFQVKPRYLPLDRMKFGAFQEKQEIAFEFPPDVAKMEAAERQGVLKATLALSTTPWSKIVPGLRYLLRYPYGCVEQTSSGIIPLAGLRRLVENNLIPGLTVEQIDKFLKPGINRLLSMQTSSGGLGYWPGDRHPSIWGSCYGIFALTMAKEAGFEVPAQRLENAAKWLHEVVFGDKKESELQNCMDSTVGILALAAVDLALNDQLSKSDLGVLMKSYDKWPAEGQAFLLWADSIVGLTPAAKLKERARALKPRITRDYSGWRDSVDRENAVALLATLMIDAGSKKVDEYAGLLLKSLQPDGKWHSTADTGWCLHALAAFFQRKGANNPGEFKVTVAQPGVAPVEVAIGKLPAELALDPEAFLKESKVTVSGPAKALVNWSLQVTYPETASRAEDLDHGFDVVKRIENLAGGNEIRVGDLVKVTVEFEDRYHQDGRWGHFEYLAIEDPLPAGLLAINTALKNDMRPVKSEEGGDDSDEGDGDEYYADWEDGFYKLGTDHSEIHEDRVLAFRNSIWSGKFRFSYFARAICEGDFRLRPTRVSLMYDPEFYGLTKAEQIKILPGR